MLIFSLTPLFYAVRREENVYEISTIALPELSNGVETLHIRLGSHGVLLHHSNHADEIEVGHLDEKLMTTYFTHRTNTSFLVRDWVNAVTKLVSRMGSIAVCYQNELLYIHGIEYVEDTELDMDKNLPGLAGFAKPKVFVHKQCDTKMFGLPAHGISCPKCSITVCVDKVDYEKLL